MDLSTKSAAILCAALQSFSDQLGRGDDLSEYAFIHDPDDIGQDDIDTLFERVLGTSNRGAVESYRQAYIRRVADAEFAAYDFGDETVAGTDGWTACGTGPGDFTLDRTFYLERTGEDGYGDSIKATFCVEFDGSFPFRTRTAKSAESFVMSSGNPIGTRGQAAL